MARIFVGIGSNIEPEKHIKIAMETLKEDFPDCKFSTVYESEAVGFKGDNFYNLVAEFHSDFSIPEIIKILNTIEQQVGRKRTGVRFSSRSLDLDLLMYDDVICDIPITLPREEITENAFVLLPLSELAPDLVHPEQLQTMKQLWKLFNHKSQKLWPVESPGEIEETN